LKSTSEKPLSENKQPLSRMRQQIARVTVKSKTEKPHFYVSADIDMTKAMNLRKQMNEQLSDQEVRITVNDLIVKASIEALKKYPKFNAYYQDDGIQYNNTVNIAVAIAEEEGLIVPAILDCAKKSLRQISEMIKDLAQRSGNGTLSTQEYTGGTFAISNLGMFDVTSFVAIIHPPQSAVLAVGTVSEKPTVKDGEILISQMMTATLSADHRIVDGAEGAEFLIKVKNLLENPMGLVV
jgi:pyruvate dehydrogenase E2 component (dihydrolipoamide acetyltransferase)